MLWMMLRQGRRAGIRFAACVYSPACALKARAALESLEPRRLLSGDAVLLADLSSGSTGSQPSWIENVGGTTFFAATTGPGGPGLYKTDGTAAGTAFVSGNRPMAFGNGGAVATTAALYFFTKQDGSVWRSDGTAAGTFAVASMGNVSNWYNVALASSNGFVYGTNAAQLWRTDGTVANTTTVFSGNPADGWLDTGSPTALGDKVFFTRRVPLPNQPDTQGEELWVTDGTAGGTTLLASFDDGLTTDPVGGLKSVGSTLYFTACDSAHGFELWESDGSIAGTHIVKDIVPGPESGGAGSIVPFGNGVAFVAVPVANGFPQVFRTDGTESGTLQVSNLQFASPSHLLSAGNYVYFNADSVWRTDGTPEGTVQQWPEGDGVPSGMLSSTYSNGTVYFRSWDEGSKGPIYRIQTSQPQQLPTLVPGLPPAVSDPAIEGADERLVINSNGTLFFDYADADHGTELWMIPNANVPNEPQDVQATIVDAAAANVVGAQRLFAASAAPAISLKWSAGSDMNGYEVQRSTSPSFATIDFTQRVDALQHQYLDTSVAADTDYYYRVRAYNPAGQSAAVEVGSNSPGVSIDAISPSIRTTAVNTMTIRFTRKVTGLDRSDLQLTRDNGGNLLSASQSLSSTDGGMTWTLSGLGGLTTAGGQYRLSLAAAAAGIADLSGHPLVTDASATWTNTSVPAPVTSTFSSVADAYVRDGSYASKNFGLATELDVRKSSTAGNQRETYLRFDLTKVASAGSITSAKIRLYGKLSAAGSVPISLFSVASSSWTETGINWSKKPLASSTAIASATVGSTSGGWLQFDVTNYLKQQKQAGAPSVSFALKATTFTTPYVLLSSDEASANKPQLVVTSQPAPAPAVGVRAAADATVRDGSYAGQNFGAAATLEVKRNAISGYSRNTVLRFDTSAIASVSSAKLRLFGALNTAGAGMQIAAYASSNTTWSEAGVTWNNRPTIASGAAPVATFTVLGTSGAWYELNLTSFVKAERAAGRKIITLVLSGVSNGDALAIFQSDEAGTANPQLLLS